MSFQSFKPLKPYPFLRVIMCFSATAHLLALLIWLMLHCEVKAHGYYEAQGLTCEWQSIFSISNQLLWDFMTQVALSATVPALLTAIWVASGRYTKIHFLETMCSGVIIAGLYGGVMHFVMQGSRWETLFHTVAALAVYPVFNMVVALMCALLWLPKKKHF